MQRLRVFPPSSEASESAVAKNSPSAFGAAAAAAAAEVAAAVAVEWP